MEKLKNLYRSYKHGLFALGYMVIYMVWFVYLEKTVTRNFTVIHTHWMITFLSARYS